MKEPASIIKQADRDGCRADFYDFGKAKADGTEFYNAAICRRKDGLWLVARRSEPREGYSYGMNSLMAFKLSPDHWPIYGIPLTVPRAERLEHFEDPRVFRNGDQDCLSACNFIIHHDGETWTGAHQVLLTLDDEWRVTRRHDPVYGKNGRSVRRNDGDEKNWLWFSHNGMLHMIYMTVPHVVVRWETMNNPISYTSNLSHPEWTYGTPRGGTAPVRIGDEYFSFFHSSMPWKGRQRRYYMGAYTFRAGSPFEITRMTTKPLLIGTQNDEWREKKPLVVFPCAAIMENGYWTVSLGINDLRSAHYHISHEHLSSKLDNNLEPVEMPPQKSPLENIFR